MKLLRITDKPNIFTSENENYVNKLSTWAAYFIFPHSVGYFAKCWWYPYTVTHNFRTV